MTFDFQPGGDIAPPLQFQLSTRNAINRIAAAVATFNLITFQPYHLFYFPPNNLTSSAEITSPPKIINRSTTLRSSLMLPVQS